MKTFEDLPIWQLSRTLNKDLIMSFQYVDDSNTGYLKNHIFKTSGSVMERSGNREFINFLSFSKGSLGELKSQLYRAYDFELINQDKLNVLMDQNANLAAQITNFMQYLKRSEFKGSKFNLG